MSVQTFKVDPDQRSEAPQVQPVQVQAVNLQRRRASRAPLHPIPRLVPVAGGVIGGLVFAVLALLLLLCCRKRRFRRRRSEEEKKADVLVRTMYEYNPTRESRHAGTVGAAI